MIPLVIDPRATSNTTWWNHLWEGTSTSAAAQQSILNNRLNKSINTRIKKEPIRFPSSVVTIYEQFEQAQQAEELLQVYQRSATFARQRLAGLEREVHRVDEGARGEGLRFKAQEPSRAALLTREGERTPFAEDAALLGGVGVSDVPKNKWNAPLPYGVPNPVLRGGYTTLFARGDSEPDSQHPELVLSGGRSRHRHHRYSDCPNSNQRSGTHQGDTDWNRECSEDNGEANERGGPHTPPQTPLSVPLLAGVASGGSGRVAPRQSTSPSITVGRGISELDDGLDSGENDCCSTGNGANPHAMHNSRFPQHLVGPTGALPSPHPQTIPLSTSPLTRREMPNFPPLPSGTKENASPRHVPAVENTFTSPPHTHLRTGSLTAHSAVIAQQRGMHTSPVQRLSVHQSKAKASKKQSTRGGKKSGRFPAETLRPAPLPLPTGAFDGLPPLDDINFNLLHPPGNTGTIMVSVPIPRRPTASCSSPLTVPDEGLVSRSTSHTGGGEGRSSTAVVSIATGMSITAVRLDLASGASSPKYPRTSPGEGVERRSPYAGPHSSPSRSPYASLQSSASQLASPQPSKSRRGRKREVDGSGVSRSASPLLNSSPLPPMAGGIFPLFGSPSPQGSPKHGGGRRRSHASPNAGASGSSSPSSSPRRRPPHDNMETSASHHNVTRASSTSQLGELNPRRSLLIHGAGEPRVDSDVCPVLHTCSTAAYPPIDRVEDSRVQLIGSPMGPTAAARFQSVVMRSAAASAVRASGIVVSEDVSGHGAVRFPPSGLQTTFPVALEEEWPCSPRTTPRVLGCSSSSVSPNRQHDQLSPNRRNTTTGRNVAALPSAPRLPLSAEESVMVTSSSATPGGAPLSPRPAPVNTVGSLNSVRRNAAAPVPPPSLASRPHPPQLQLQMPCASEPGSPLTLFPPPAFEEHTLPPAAAAAFVVSLPLPMTSVELAVEDPNAKLTCFQRLASVASRPPSVTHRHRYTHGNANSHFVGRPTSEGAARHLEGQDVESPILGSSAFETAAAVRRKKKSKMDIVHAFFTSSGIGRTHRHQRTGKITILSQSRCPVLPKHAVLELNVDQPKWDLQLRRLTQKFYKVQMKCPFAPVRVELEDEEDYQHCTMGCEGEQYARNVLRLRRLQLERDAVNRAANRNIVHPEDGSVLGEVVVLPLPHADAPPGIPGSAPLTPPQVVQRYIALHGDAAALRAAHNCISAAVRSGEASPSLGLYYQHGDGGPYSMGDGRAMNHNTLTPCLWGTGLVESSEMMALGGSPGYSNALPNALLGSPLSRSASPGGLCKSYSNTTTPTCINRSTSRPLLQKLCNSMFPNLVFPVLAIAQYELPPRLGYDELTRHEVLLSTEMRRARRYQHHNEHFQYYNVQQQLRLLEKKHQREYLQEQGGRNPSNKSEGPLPSSNYTALQQSPGSPGSPGGPMLLFTPSVSLNHNNNNNPNLQGSAAHTAGQPTAFPHSPTTSLVSGATPSLERSPVSAAAPTYAFPTSLQSPSLRAASPQHPSFHSLDRCRSTSPHHQHHRPQRAINNSRVHRSNSPQRAGNQNHLTHHLRPIRAETSAEGTTVTTMRSARGATDEEFPPADASVSEDQESFLVGLRTEETMVHHDSGEEPQRQRSAAPVVWQRDSPAGLGGAAPHRREEEEEESASRREYYRATTPELYGWGVPYTPRIMETEMMLYPLTGSSSTPAGVSPGNGDHHNGEGEATHEENLHDLVREDSREVVENGNVHHIERYPPRRRSHSPPATSFVAGQTSILDPGFCKPSSASTRGGGIHSITDLRIAAGGNVDYSTSGRRILSRIVSPPSTSLQQPYFMTPRTLEEEQQGLVEWVAPVSPRSPREGSSSAAGPCVANATLCKISSPSSSPSPTRHAVGGEGAASRSSGIEGQEDSAGPWKQNSATVSNGLHTSVRYSPMTNNLPTIQPAETIPCHDISMVNDSVDTSGSSPPLNISIPVEVVQRHEPMNGVGSGSREYFSGSFTAKNNSENNMSFKALLLNGNHTTEVFSPSVLLASTPPSMDAPGEGRLLHLPHVANPTAGSRHHTAPPALQSVELRERSNLGSPNKSAVERTNLLPAQGGPTTALREKPSRGPCAPSGGREDVQSPTAHFIRDCLLSSSTEQLSLKEGSSDGLEETGEGSTRMEPGHPPNRRSGVEANTVLFTFREGSSSNLPTCAAGPKEPEPYATSSPSPRNQASSYGYFLELHSPHSPSQTQPQPQQQQPSSPGATRRSSNATPSGVRNEYSFFQHPPFYPSHSSSPNTNHNNRPYPRHSSVSIMPPSGGGSSTPRRAHVESRSLSSPQRPPSEGEER